MTDRAYRPTPEIDELSDGDLQVRHSSHIRDGSAVVARDDRPLFELLLDILADEHIPDLMPAHLAAACEDLVDVRETVMGYHRGSVDLPGGSYGMGFCHRVRDAIDEHRDREPVTLVAVGCSASKHDVDEPVPAAELYRSAYWTCKREYGETIGDDWRIVSAKHALLEPAEAIAPYERTPEDLAGIPVDSDRRLPSGESVATLLDRWALRVYDGLQAWLRAAAGGIDPRAVELVVLLGRSYRDPLAQRGVFDALRGPAELSVSFPFQEVEQAQGGNGNQMGWLTDVVAAATAPVATDGGDPA
jgi:hypothetical protein